jgi:hypothetical protein
MVPQSPHTGGAVWGVDAAGMLWAALWVGTGPGAFTAALAGIGSFVITWALSERDEGMIPVMAPTPTTLNTVMATAARVTKG